MLQHKKHHQTKITQTTTTTSSVFLFDLHLMKKTETKPKRRIFHIEIPVEVNRGIIEELKVLHGVDVDVEAELAALLQFAIEEEKQKQIQEDIRYFEQKVEQSKGLAKEKPLAQLNMLKQVLENEVEKPHQVPAKVSFGDIAWEPELLLVRQTPELSELKENKELTAEEFYEICYRNSLDPWRED